MFLPSPSPAIHAYLALLLDFQVDLIQRTLDASQRLGTLNLQLGRNLLAETAANAQRLAASKDFHQFSAALSANYLPANALSIYQQGVTEALCSLQTSLNQSASAHMPGVRRSAGELTDDLVIEATGRTIRAAEQLARFQPGGQLRH